MQIEQDKQGVLFPKVEVKHYNVMTNGQNFLYQPVNNDLRMYDNI